MNPRIAFFTWKEKSATDDEVHTYTINYDHIVDIHLYKADTATVTLSNGKWFALNRENYDALMRGNNA
jgi:hypothetical protein